MERCLKITCFAVARKTAIIRSTVVVDPADRLWILDTSGSPR
jgi:hypothetical protein